MLFKVLSQFVYNSLRDDTSLFGWYNSISDASLQIFVVSLPIITLRLEIVRIRLNGIYHFNSNSKKQCHRTLRCSIIHGASRFISGHLASLIIYRISLYRPKYEVYASSHYGVIWRVNSIVFRILGSFWRVIAMVFRNAVLFRQMYLRIWVWFFSPFSVGLVIPALRLEITRNTR